MPLPMHQPGQGSPKYVIAVAAGKGGVGKSSVTVNLALALQKAGYKVGIMDTDIYGPSIRRMLPEERLPTQQGPTIFPALCHGLSVISLAYFRKENEAAVIRAPIATSIVTQFIEQVQWGPLDFLLIDFPPGTGDVQLTLSQRAKLTGAVMVTTPQEVAVMDVRKAIDMFNQVQVPILGIVENMSYYYHAKTQEKLCLFGSGGGQRLADEVGAPFLGKIPLDPAVSKNGDEGLSLFDGSEDAGGAAKAFQELATQVVAHAKVLQNSVVDGISKIEQKDPQTITILWNDGQQREYRLSDLQRRCPCAACVDEFTGKRTADPAQVKDDVGAVRISSVGRYALKFQFTSGCSTGIYGFDLLRTWGEPKR